jgi:hypothetical protein
MAFYDALLLTLLNAVACLAFPKMLSVVLNREPKAVQKSQKTLELKKATVEVMSFPFCVTQKLTSGPTCKFSPNFCVRCSSIN